MIRIAAGTGYYCLSLIANILWVAVGFCHDLSSNAVLFHGQLYHRLLFDFDGRRLSGVGGEQSWDAQIRKRRQAPCGCWLLWTKII